MTDYSTLLPTNWKAKIQQWLDEDIPSFDYGGFIVGDAPQKAVLYCKAKGVVAGVPFFDAIFEYLGCQVEWLVKEGAMLDPSTEANHKIVAAYVTGPARKILLGERTALNLMARASGIASNARRVQQLVAAQHWKGSVAATRKTTPGIRLVEKYAVLVGGCDPHRFDLSSMIMLKDNHIKSAGNIAAAVQRAKEVGGFAVKVEVECGSLDAAMQAAAAGADVVMLDNFSPADIAPVARAIRRDARPGVIIEASGGITTETVTQYMLDEIDVISMGNIIQAVQYVDFSLKIEHVAK